MADVIANLVAVVSADISNLTEGLTGAKKNIGDFGRTLTTSLTLPIVGLGTLAIKSFSDSQTALTQLNAVLKSTKGIAGVTAKQAIDLSKALQKVTRYSDEDVLSAENMLLTFTKIGKDIFPDTTKIALDMSTALGQDLKSSAIQLGKALQDPINGVTALRRVGVNFSDQQMEMIKQMMAVGNLAGAQKLILKELQTEFGGSAVAAGSTFAGAMDKLKNKFDDFLEVVGEKMAPTLSKGIDFLSGLIDKLSALPPGVIEIGLAAAAAVAALGPLLTILGNIGTALGLLLSPIGLLIAGILLVGTLAVQHFGGIDKLLKAASDSARTLINLVAVGIGFAAAQVAILFVRIQETLQNGITNATLWIKARWQEIAAIVSNILNKMAAIASGIPGVTVTSNGPVVGKEGMIGGGGGSSLLGGALGGGRSARSFAVGGYTGEGAGIAGLVHGGEYVVPKGGALVSGGGGPQTIHLIADFGDAVQHFYFNVGEAINRGNAMPLRRMG